MKIGKLINKTLKEKSILIVDNESTLRRSLLDYFQKAEVDFSHIVLAETGQEALRKIQNQEFGLIIVDIGIPKINGIQVLRELKLNMRTKNIPVLLMGENVKTEVVQQAVLYGVKHILTKPFDYCGFLKKVLFSMNLITHD
jgi:CheY-like chemotaxis protein